MGERRHRLLGRSRRKGPETELSEGLRGNEGQCGGDRVGKREGGGRDVRARCQRSRLVCFVPSAQALVQGCTLKTQTEGVCAQPPRSCPRVCDPMDCGPSGSSVRGVSQTRTLQWVAIAFSTHRLRS